MIDGLKQELELTKTKTVHLSQKLSESQHEVNLLREQLKAVESPNQLPRRDNFFVEAAP